MPKAARYHLSWVDEQGIYAVRSADNNEHTIPDLVGSPEWFSWLRSIPSFTFTGKLGQLTVRQETRGGAGTYWYAYRRHGDKMLKRYLGRTADLTPAHLEKVALHLTVLSVSSPKPEQPAEGPLQALVQAQGRDQTSTPETDRATHEAASPTPEPSPARRSANLVGTTPHALHEAHHLLLATKFHPPRPRTQLVSRGPLVERLQRGVRGALTLVSAPAGYGKTTLLAQWLASTLAPVAWLSLESEENEPTQFFTYLLAALQTLDPHFGARAQARLRLLQSADLETVLALLINDLINWQAEDFTLVLDDYHVITATPIHRALTHLVEHLPPQMSLIIATRSDPPLPLARLRALGHLTELRATELRFGATEASAFLEKVMRLHLSQEEVTTLQTRTEGWIAGLQLAALSLQSRADIASALAAFTGGHRFVLDYLSEEVLSRQPTQVQTFLLQTSVLERLSGSLCDAVTGSQESQAMLETLDRANLFVIALDDVRGWYRYHHLFADLLRSRLQKAMPTSLPELHQRASRWYEAHDVILEAVHHAILAPDLERTTRLIEEHRHALVLRGQARTVLAFLHAFPDERIQRHPSLRLSQGLLLMLTGQLPEAFMRLQMAEQSASFITEECEAQAFLHQVAALQAYILFFQGDLESSVALAEQASNHLAHCPPEVREGAHVIAAHRVMLSGEVSHVDEQHMAQFTSALSTRNDLSAMETLLNLTGILLQARLLRLQGRLRQAAATYEQMVQFQGEHEGTFISPGSCFGLGELAYEWNDLDTAERLLEQGREALRGSLTLEASTIAQGYATLARLHQARNNHSHALAFMEEFERLAQTRQFAPMQLASARAVRARLAVMQGDFTEAVRWAEASGLSASDELSHPREQEYLTFARVRIAQGRLDPGGAYLAEVSRLLERLRADAEAKARMDSVLEILVLQALAFSAASAHRRHALPALERALLLGEQEGYIRLFVDEGEPMAALLRQAYTLGIAPDYIVNLLSAFDEQPKSSPLRTFPLVEPLTERELTVFRLLVTGLSNAEIARDLIITVGTVKRHLNSIYGKLGVQSRAQAIARAQALHVL
ncbi:LuxR C-terminal-related transcriptional regulator [Ktedonospora formicarum]|uniref:Helix-turn-helix transcriptional regulator n=1 Tax=Ktedonospora formicarum TaxID=2778364 RepID=A0A8J3MYB6_9CHLR|nr:LuxR C-terminal-related transcriptional regulator [Ktedonospora formicarum]GHO50623.1 helix-turn-helix transcriptional regulator [Ktedonospora formicarum]